MTQNIDQVRAQHFNEQTQLSVELYHLDTRSEVVRGRLKELAVIMQTIDIIAPQEKPGIKDDGASPSGG